MSKKLYPHCLVLVGSSNGYECVSLSNWDNFIEPYWISTWMSNKSTLCLFVYNPLTSLCLFIYVSDLTASIRQTLIYLEIVRKV